MPFVCSETNKLGEELVGSYLYQVHLYHELEFHDYDRSYQATMYIEVKRMVYLLGRSDSPNGVAGTRTIQHRFETIGVSRICRKCASERQRAATQLDMKLASR